MEKKFVLAFEELEWQEVQRIVIDRDKDAALRLLKDVVKKIERQSESGCKPAFEVEGLKSNLRKQGG
jgi:benzoyl-CoA reductase/2-hydroxyglutaryl-CoA dehydratase subunit BcrC/BadD/HgdB